MIDALCKSALSGVQEAINLLEVLGITYYKNGRWSRKAKGEKENIIDKIEEASRRFEESRLTKTKRVSNDTMTIADRLRAEMFDLSPSLVESECTFSVIDTNNLKGYGTTCGDDSNISLEKAISLLKKEHIHKVAIVVKNDKPHIACALCVPSDKVKVCKKIEKCIQVNDGNARFDGGEFIKGWSWFEVL